MKILIADDEKLVRFSIRSMLEEIGVAPDAIVAACDGEEMIEAARRTRPDLALVDIRMPRLDGLSGIEQARVVSPDTRWVILTSHSSFEFAQKAIRLGAIEYLLKPVSPRELQTVVDRTAAELRQDLVRINEEFEGRIGSLMHGTLSLESEQVEFVSTARFSGALLLFDGTLDEKRLVEWQLECCCRIRARVAAALEKTIRIALCTLPEGQMALVCAWAPGPAAAMARAAVTDFLGRVHLMLGAPDAEVKVTQVVSGDCDSFLDLLERLHRANDLAALRVPLGIGRQIDLTDMDAPALRARWTTAARHLDGIAQAFRDRNRLDFLAGLELAQREMDGMDPDALAAARPALARFSQGALGVAPGPEPETPSWWAALRAAGEGLRTEETPVVAGDLVADVVSFVRANYMRDIGIGRIAQHLGVTPNYLSTLFHREKGVTFVRYLTRLRLEKARELLETPGAHVQEVSRSVGYASVRHFSRLFQKQFGTYPSEITRAEKSAPES